MGATVYNGIFEPGQDCADENGFRRDVMELVRELKLSCIRYPGGNFVSGFNWEDSVGPVDRRPTKLDLAWRAVEPNTFGLNEFMKWMGLVSCEPIMTVNLGTRGADAARNLLEYCNFEKGSYYSDLRRSHGVEKPYGIKIWCLGNELDGPWQIASKTADEYGRIATEAGKVMKLVDPTIELVAVGSSTPRMESYPEWDKTVLMHTYETADYISLHHYIDRTILFSEISSDTYFTGKEKEANLNTEQYLARTLHVDRQIHDIISTCDYVKSVKRSRKTMKLSFDEWNVVAPRKHAGMEHEDWKTGSPIDCGAHSMEDALAFASMMMAIIRRADRIKLACQSLLVNTGPLIVTGKHGPAFRNTIFYPFMHVSGYGRGDVLQAVVDAPVYSTEEFEKVPVIDCLAVYNEEPGELTFFAVNRSASPVELDLDVRNFGKVAFNEHIYMADGDMKAANTEDNPNRVIPRKAEAASVMNGHATTVVPGFSWNVIRLCVS
jgi:alpha-N-arabinofuranosidase